MMNTLLDKQETIMGQLTTLDELRQHIFLLAKAEEGKTPFISAYLNLENGSESCKTMLNERAQLLRRVLKGNDLTDFEESLEKIESWLATDLHPDAKGAAVIIRGSLGGAFMLPMQFAAPLPNWLALYPTPNIYHLVELKDNYHRYVILLTLPERASILEVNLGAATTQAWIDQTESRMRVGTEWTRPHFQIHQSHRGERFLREKIGILEKLMSSGGQTHLILAGDPDSTQRVRHALPDHLVNKLVDVIPASSRDEEADVVMATLSSFIEHEELESQSITESLLQGIRNQNLAVAGPSESLAALRWGDVDTLILVQDFQFDPGWLCTECLAYGNQAPVTAACSKCGAEAVRPLDIRETMLRLAAQCNIQVEVVEHSDALMSLGGVGCLLRSEYGWQSKYKSENESFEKWNQ